jgi:hypothetical protein
VAVDCDGRRVWLVDGEPRGSDARFHRVVCVDVPDDVDSQDGAAMGRFLATALKQHRLEGKPLLMALPRRVAVLRQVALPAATPDDEVVGMARFQVLKDLPFDPSEAVIDIQPAGRSADGTQRLVLAGVARQSTLAYFRDLAAAGKLTLAGVGLSSISARACLSACRDDSAAAMAMLVHLGHQRVDVELPQADALPLSRSLPCGDLGQPEARRDLADELARVVQGHRAGAGGGEPVALRIVGGTGHEADLLAELRRHRVLGDLDSAALNPAAHLGVKSDDARTAGAITAMGLILTQAQRRDLDFLHPADEDPGRDSRQARRRIALLAAAALVLAVVGGSFLMLHQRRAALRELEAKVATLQNENKQVTALAKRVRALEAWQSEQRPWLDHWAQLSSLLPPATDVYITSITTRPGGGIQFTVKAKRSQAISDLARRLHEAGYDFQPGQVATASDRFGYPFSADIRLSAPAPGGMRIEPDKLTAPARPEDDASLQRIAEEPQRRRRQR